MADKTEVKASDQDVEDSAPKQDGAEVKAEPSKDLKVVVSLKGGITTVGVQRPEADPYIESFAHDRLEGVLDEIVPVVERATDRWEDAPKNPEHKRVSAQSGGGRRAGRTAAAQAASGGDSATGAEKKPALQQTKLF